MREIEKKEIGSREGKRVARLTVWVFFDFNFELQFWNMRRGILDLGFNFEPMDLSRYSEAQYEIRLGDFLSSNIV